MSLASPGGGGSDIKVNAETLGAVASTLRSDATRLDEKGNSLPQGGDLGVLASVVSGATTLAVEAAHKAVIESDLLGTLVKQATEQATTTDQETAQRAAQQSLISGLSQ